MRKKVFIPIGALIIAICAVGLLSLRSDQPAEPIKIYKVTTPAKVSTTPAETPTETAKRESTNGHQDSHAIEISAQVESRQGEDWEKLQDTRNASESIAFGGETESQTPEPPSEASLAEQRYNIATAEYFEALQEYHRKYQKLNKEWELLQAQSNELTKAAEVAIKTVNREEAAEMQDAFLDMIARRNELWEKIQAFRAQKPIAPTPPASMERSRN